MKWNFKKAENKPIVFLNDLENAAIQDYWKMPWSLVILIKHNMVASRKEKVTLQIKGLT